MPALLSPKAIKWCGVVIASGHHHAQHLAIAMEVGEGRAYTNFGIASHSLMDYSKAIEHHTTRSTWRLQRRWSTGRGRAGSRDQRRARKEGGLFEMCQHLVRFSPLGWQVTRGRRGILP